MAKTRPEFLPGYYYHIYNRGANKQQIFKEKSNYLYVIKYLKKYSIELDVSIVAYCLMPNHYHFLVRQNGHYPAGLIPQRIFNSYTKAFNRSYSHSGTLFEGRYRSKVVEDVSYLIYLCKYIHINPIKAGLVTKPEDWIYSNYQEFLGLRRGSIFDPEFFDEYFHDKKDYFDFVTEDLSAQNVPKVLKQYWESLSEV